MVPRFYDSRVLASSGCGGGIHAILGQFFSRSLYISQLPWTLASTLITKSNNDETTIPSVHSLALPLARSLTHQEGLLSGEGNNSALLLPVLLGLVEGLEGRKK